MTKCPENDRIKAVVTGFSRNGEIAFAKADNYGKVTFLLDLTVWGDSVSPQKGQVVILSGMARFTKGWRASKARPFVLDDERKSSE